MHELSICQAILVQVRDIAQAYGAKGVKQITVAVGPLSGVEPSLLAEAFQWVRAGSCAASAELRLQQMPVTIRCIECGAESACEPNLLLCSACRGFRTQLIGGDELCLMRVELLSSEEAGWSSDRLN